ncbi:hypothetical protein HGP28_03695 [Vibrio sp. SM6]|uniref:Lipoprotein n=1 Tax=Vibrio agarilyticus TaxID=2726741 RepID=A0A7X8YFT5_9VIBR|nr:hypothetical protein [Vibrio agarilyticus]NLS11994.1 hypothetical protein [Vibrio agarilyticus]
MIACRYYRHSVNAASFILLCGCQMTDLRPEKAPDTASIRFSNQGANDAALIVHHKPSVCQDWRGASQIKQMETKEMTINAEGSIAFSFGYDVDMHQYSKSLPTRQCAITTIFSPKPNQDYEALIVSVYNGCSVYLYQLVNGHKHPVPHRSYHIDSLAAKDERKMTQSQAQAPEHGAHQQARQAQCTQ